MAQATSTGRDVANKGLTAVDPMLTPATRLRLQEILRRIGEDQPVSLEERIDVQKFADRNQAVAGARRLRPSSDGLPDLELSLHPGWQHLLGEPLQLLLERCAAGAEQLVVRSDVLDGERSRWLQSLGQQARERTSVQ